VQRLTVSTDVFVGPGAVYQFLVDFQRYAKYTEHLEGVERRGDGGEGTVYDITVAWWRLSHTVRSVVTEVHPPERIDWRLRGPVGAHGAWVIDGHDAVADADLGEPPAGASVASRVTLDVTYDPGTIADARLSLPAFLSFDGLVDRLVPVVRDEATSTVERIVADLEGRKRPVELRVGSGEDGADEG
jgi:hypothetical protein